jgi:SAM-dependent methyltransferase
MENPRPRSALTAKIEPFDSFWEAPENVQKGFDSFGKFYRNNYLKHLPENRDAKILVISCGYGYFVHLLKSVGYTAVSGIDSDPEKVRVATEKGLNCTVGNAFPFLGNPRGSYDVIIAEQEINHLTKEEIIIFLNLCRKSLVKGGALLVHSLNGANPITGSEALAQNFDHYNTFTEYSLRQVLEHTGFGEVNVFPLNLYVFYNNPLNYVALLADRINTLIFRINFILYGKHNRIFTKKIAAVGKKRDVVG